MDDKSGLIVNGYCFGTSEDADLARQELKKIEYLERHMDYDNPKNMLLVYQKAVKDNIFRTPIGWEYLKELREKIYSNGEFESENGDILPITLFTVFAYRVGSGVKEDPSQTESKEENRLKKRFITSVLINIMLAAAMAAMFAITLTSDQPNILNYERALVNKYAEWQQELTERENIVREKERDLLIEE